MLIRLTPEQVANNWDFIRRCIVAEAPIDTLGEREEVENNILLCLLSGVMHCWFEGKALDETKEHFPRHEIRAVVVTQFVEHPITQKKGLHIYSLFGMNNAFQFEDWSRGLLTLVRFASGNGCEYIQALTANEGILKFLSRFGANAEYRLVCLPIR